MHHRFSRSDILVGVAIIEGGRHVHLWSSTIKRRTIIFLGEKKTGMPAVEYALLELLLL